MDSSIFKIYVEDILKRYPKSYSLRETPLNFYLERCIDGSMDDLKLFWSVFHEKLGHEIENRLINWLPGEHGKILKHQGVNATGVDKKGQIILLDEEVFESPYLSFVKTLQVGESIFLQAVLILNKEVLQVFDEQENRRLFEERNLVLFECSKEQKNSLFQKFSEIAKDVPGEKPDFETLIRFTGVLFNTDRIVSIYFSK